MICVACATSFTLSGVAIACQPLLTIPAGKYLCGYHCGSYETIGETASRMRRAVPEGRFADELINFNVIDQFVEKDRDKYITNVQIMTMEPDANS